MKCVSPLSGVLLVWLWLGLPAGLRCSLEEQVSSGMLEMMSTGQGWLNHTAVRSLFNQLERRVQWAAVSCEKCQPLLYLDQLVRNYSSEGLRVEHLYRVSEGCGLYISSPALACTAMREGRWGEETDRLLRSIRQQEEQAGELEETLSSLLQDMQTHYRPAHHHVECLSSRDIMAEVSMWSSNYSTVSMVMGSIVYHVLRGDCLTGHALPGETYFLDSIMQRLGNNSVTVSELEDLMSSLKIGETHHEEHDHLHPEDLHAHQDDSHRDHSHQDDSHRDHSHQDDSHRDHSHQDDSHRDHSHQDDSHRDHSHQDDSHHDHSHQDHNHTEEGQGRNSSWDQVCFTAQQLVQIYGMNGSALVRSDLARLSPALVQQLLSGACSALPLPDPSDSLTTTERFVYASIANLLISLTSMVGIVVLLCTSCSSVFQLCIQFCVSLAVGSLTGDALLHLMPTVLGLHVHEEGSSHSDEPQDHVYKLLVVMAGIYYFYLMETVFSIVTQKKEHHHHPHHHGEEEEPHHCDHGKVLEMYQEKRKTASQTDLVDGEDKEAVSPKKERTKEQRLLPFMITLGDGIHNFADGLAIGAAFSVSWRSGLASSLAVLCHELPHELGDFAILLQSGVSVRRALMLNVGCAMTSFGGLYLALSIATDAATKQWIAAVTTGMFLYVGLADMLPTMVHVDSRHPWLMFFLQNVGLLTGWSILLLLSLYEDRIHF
ncbi:zinc transporter ZIP4-like [Osmerus mordax]|uniref:zinc transporter ZIP4-like n=2 Tax=Osmerus mordax TaxID=8014 RepID=UPI00350F902A